MPLFPVLLAEALVQENDKTRLDGTKSYASGVNAITKVEIMPEAGGDFIDVTASGYLDWEYDSDGTKVVSLRVTNDADPTPDTETITKDVVVISEADDLLFSTDDMLRKRESDILNYLPDGRSTWKDIHRQAQEQILIWLDTQGFIDDFGDKLVAARFKDATEVQEWSTMTALRLIMDNLVVSQDDVFFKKARQYEKLEAFFRNRAVLRVDLNKDGQVDLGEQLAVQPIRVVRR